MPASMNIIVRQLTLHAFVIIVLCCRYWYNNSLQEKVSNVLCNLSQFTQPAFDSDGVQTLIKLITISFPSSYAILIPSHFINCFLTSH